MGVWGLAAWGWPPPQPPGPLGTQRAQVWVSLKALGGAVHWSSFLGPPEFPSKYLRLWNSHASVRGSANQNIAGNKCEGPIQSLCVSQAFILSPRAPRPTLGPSSSLPSLLRSQKLPLELHLRSKFTTRLASFVVSFLWFWRRERPSWFPRPTPPHCPDHTLSGPRAQGLSSPAWLP